MIYITDEGKRLDLKDEAKKGAEGKIYLLNNCAVKIYHEEDNGRSFDLIRDFMEAKLTWMIQSPPKPHNLKYFAWPEHLVYSQNGKFCGFTMKRVESYATLSELLTCNDERFEQALIIRAAQNFCALAHSVHAERLIVADFNPANFLVLKDGRVVMVDIDSVHIDTNGVYYPAQAATPTYCATEILRTIHSRNIRAYADLPRGSFTRSTDYFACYVMAFRLLMKKHPFESIKEDADGVRIAEKNDIERNIAAGRCLYFKKEKGYRLAKYAYPITILPPELQKLFRRCFVDGEHNPDARPSAMELYYALDPIAEKAVQIQEGGAISGGKGRKKRPRKTNPPIIKQPKPRSNHWLGRMITPTLAGAGMVLTDQWLQKNWSFRFEQLAISKNTGLTYLILFFAGFFILGGLISVPLGWILRTKKNGKRKMPLKRLCRIVGPALALLTVTVGVTASAARLPISYVLTQENYYIDYPAKVKLYKQAEKTMSAEQKYRVGRYYQKGITIYTNPYGNDLIKNPDIVKKRETKAVKWYRMAYKENNDHAAAALGRCYCKGIGVKKDTAKGKRLLREAAKAGDSTAMYDLYKQNSKEGRNKTAKKWLKKAAEAGNRKAKSVIEMRAG